MGQRSRKRRATGGTSAAIPDPRNSPRRGEAGDEPAGGESSAGGAPGARAPSRSAARDEAARQSLEPLAPGERPTAVTIAAILATALAVANVVVYLAGWEVNGSEPSLRGLLIYCAVLVTAAVGMWLRQYWAVLGFQMLLAGSVIIAALFLLRASNWQAVLFCVGVIAVCGPLFWFLIRAMARLQMPSRTR